MDYERWLAELRQPFPSLNAANSRGTSPPDDAYNCVAWAAGETNRWWWPDPQAQQYWPQSAPREESLPAFKQAFELLGYSETSSLSHEPGAEKIAIFVSAAGVPTHVARQLASGLWTSKLGQAIDIEHELVALEGPVYGAVGLILSRQWRDI